MKTTHPKIRRTIAMAITASVAGMPFAMTGCEKTETVEKTKVTKTTETPTQTKTTVETTEKKIETTPKP